MGQRLSGKFCGQDSNHNKKLSGGREACCHKTETQPGESWGARGPPPPFFKPSFGQNTAWRLSCQSGEYPLFDTFFFGPPPLKNTGYPPERAHFNYLFIFALQITTCFSKIFNECPLHIYCTGLWVNPSTGGETEIIMIVFTVIFIDVCQVVSCHASKNLCDRPSLHFGRT